MTLSKEEIEDIAKTTAQEVINKLHRYAISYQEPETVVRGLQESAGEELTAADWYRRRAAHARTNRDEVTAQLFAHIAGEEDRHFEEFNTRLLELSQTKSVAATGLNKKYEDLNASGQESVRELINRQLRYYDTSPLGAARLAAEKCGLVESDALFDLAASIYNDINKQK